MPREDHLTLKPGGRDEKRNLLQRLVANLSWVLISELGGKAIYFAVGIYLARRLAVANYGLLAFTQSVTSYFWLATDLGINMYGSREIAKQKDQAGNIINALLTVRCLAAAVTWLILIVSVSLLVSDFEQKLIFYGSSLFLLTRALNTDWAFRGLESFGSMAISNLANFSIMLALMIIFIQGDKDTIKVNFLSSLSYLSGVFLLFYILAKKYRIYFRPVSSWRILLSHLKNSIHFTIAGGLMVISKQVPLIFLGIFATSHELGLFAASYNLVITMSFVISIIQIAIYPMLSELYYHKYIDFKIMLRYYQAFMVFIGISIVLFGTIFNNYIILILFGEKYLSSAPIFSGMVWLIFLASITGIYGLVINAAGLQRYNVIAGCLGLLAMVLCLFSLIFLFHLNKLTAAVISLLFCEMTQMIVQFFVWKTKNTRNIRNYEVQTIL